jgi:hypothetical protein
MILQRLTDKLPLAIAAFILATTNTFACTDIPANQLQSHQQLVARTSSIVVAQVISLQPINGDFNLVEFLVVDTLKGNQKSNFSLSGFPAKDKLGRYDYGQHRDLDFLVYSNTGNFTRLDDCRVYGHFEQGRQYLIFIDQPHHPRSFEVISSPDDGWLAEIRNIITP